MKERGTTSGISISSSKALSWKRREERSEELEGGGHRGGGGSRIEDNITETHASKIMQVH